MQSLFRKHFYPEDSTLADDKMQVVIFNAKGEILASDNTLVSMDIQKYNLFSEAVFEGFSEVLESVAEEEEFVLECIETSFAGRQSTYDFRISWMEGKKEEKQFMLIVLDVNSEYMKMHELIQERNSASIHAQELAIAQRKLTEALKNEKVARERLATAQTQLIQSEKMASIGQLTAGMGHEINNPLNFINNGVKLLEEKLKVLEANLEAGNQKSTLSDTQKMLEVIQSGADRIHGIVKELHQFSRMDDKEMILTDIHESLDVSISFLNYQVKDDLLIEKNYDSSVQKLKCHTGRLNQVFLNLLLNAAQSFTKKEQGKIILKTKHSQNGITISVSDNGDGIADAVKPHIFDPFFTAKEVGTGPGLGLPISHRIVEEHNGKLSFTSQEGVGSEFVVYLPYNSQS